MKENILVLDTETSGLPINYTSPYDLDSYKDARMLELAYIIYNENEEILKEYSSLVYPKDIVIKNSHIHGITQENVEKNGIDINLVLSTFFEDIIKYNIKCLVAHNINFDLSIIISETVRSNMNDKIPILQDVKIYCTMLKSIKYNSGRWPKLILLYSILFDEKLEDIKQEHRALSDVKLCSECYFRLKMIEKMNTERKKKI